MALGDEFDKGLLGSPMYSYSHEEKLYTRVDEVKDLIGLFKKYGYLDKWALKAAIDCVYSVDIDGYSKDCNKDREDL